MPGRTGLQLVLAGPGRAARRVISGTGASAWTCQGRPVHRRRSPGLGVQDGAEQRGCGGPPGPPRAMPPTPGIGAAYRGRRLKIPARVRASRARRRPVRQRPEPGAPCVIDGRQRSARRQSSRALALVANAAFVLGAPARGTTATRTPAFLSYARTYRRPAGARDGEARGRFVDSRGRHASPLEQPGSGRRTSTQPPLKEPP